MKVMKRDLKEGSITLQVDTLDDLWHLYNIVSSGDRVVSRTVRRVRVGDEDSRKQESVRRPMTLVLLVDDVSFHTFSNRVRIKGTILEGPSDLVSIGSHHTFNVEPGSVLTVRKDHWPEYLLKRITEAEKERASAVTLLVTIEDGSAELFLVADFGLREAVSVRTDISRKRGDQKAFDSTMEEFFSDVVSAVRSQLEQHQIGLLVIAGPGFVKEHFAEYLRKASIKSLPTLIVEGTNSIGIPGAKELLFRGIISKTVAELKIETETQLIEELITHVAKNDGLGAYGDAEVEQAVQYGAVAHLLVTDLRLRECSAEQRRWIDRLIHDVEKTRGTFHVVSTEHPAGDQLHNLGGIAAVLRFKVQ
ncbi:MAG: mRNA surveillance protein pelota [Candidatus Thorarchaeota archaeon]|nr:mRNA surveillance protein pelota [Candidatus Thorarchaeota archaeon]